MENVVCRIIHTLRFIMLIENQEISMTLILEYIQNAISLKKQKESRKLQIKATKFFIIDGKLYKRGFTQPLLKCLRETYAKYVMAEIHEGCYGQHFGHKTLPRKILRADYYWSTIKTNIANYV